MLRQDLSGFSFNLYFEYVAVFILIIMLIYMFVEKLFIMKRSKILLFLISLLVICTSLDIFGAYTVNRIIEGTSNPELFKVVNILETTYIMLLFISVHFYVTYIVHISCGFHYLRRKKLELILFYLPLAIGLPLIITNYFYPLILNYGYDTAPYFESNIFALISVHGIEIIYVVLSILLIYRYRVMFEKKQRIAASLIPVILVAGIVIEMVMPKYLVIQLMFALCIIIIQTTFESSEDMIDGMTNLYNLSEFVRQLNKYFLNGDKKAILLFKMTNFSELRKTYDYVEVYKYCSLVTGKINEFRSNNGLVFTTYSLNNGYYALVFNRVDLFDVEVNNNLIKAIYMIPACNDYYPTVERCLIEIPNDFDSVNEVTKFVNNYRQAISFKNDFTKYSDVSNDHSLIISNNLDQIIDTALKEKEFKVYYQPIYSVEKKRFISAEALVRLVSRKYGFISPGSFIPFAEKTGRIEEIDLTVIEEVFKFVSSTVFKMLGLSYIELNLSMAEIINPIFIKRVRELMLKYNVNPDNINMEITESFESSELGIINDNLRKLTDMGFKLSLDDYGTGYSNINRFVSLPISIVKIDKSLVDESENEGIKKILDYAFTLVRSLNKETVVEGIETEDQLNRFIEFGADFIQGYYFSKPLDFDKFVEFLYKNNM